jgi:hypothetical protein
MAWVSLAIAILSLGVAFGTFVVNRRAINAEAQHRQQEANDRREQLDLIAQQVQGVIDRESRGLSGALAIVCNELGRAAELADAYHGQNSAMKDLQDALPRDAWRAHRQELAGALRDEPIWRELLEVESALDRTKSRGAVPPTSDVLNELVARLQSS